MTPTRLFHLSDPIVRVVVEVQPPTLCISLDGELDLSCYQLLEAVTRVDLADVTEVLILLKDLTFCDLAGLRAMTDLQDRLQRTGRRVRFLDPQPCVRRIAELAGRSDLLAAG